jgi:hypothetical protein
MLITMNNTTDPTSLIFSSFVRNNNFYNLDLQAYNTYDDDDINRKNLSNKRKTD